MERWSSTPSFKPTATPDERGISGDTYPSQPPASHRPDSTSFSSKSGSTTLFVRSQRTEPTIEDDLIGPTSEANILLEDVLVPSLQDSGSVVSTITEEFYQQYLYHLPLHSLKELVH